jgi:hypothetical protein
MKKTILEEKSGSGAVENRERESENEDVVERMVNEVLESGTEVVAESDCRSKPLGKGAEVWAEESVDRVGDTMMRSESAIR